MDILLIISGIFLEFIALILGALAFALLLKEYSRRHRSFLLHCTLAFFSFAAGIAFFFLGQLFEAYGMREFIPAFSTLPLYLFVLQSLFVCLALMAAFVPRPRAFWYLVIMAVVLVSYAATAQFTGRTVNAGGFTVPALRLQELAPISGTFFLASVLLIVLPGIRNSRRRAKKLRAHRSDAYFRRAGAFGLLFVAASAAAVALGVAALMLAAIMLIAAFYLFLFFGAVANENPDVLLAEDPCGIVSHSVVFKSVLFTTVLFLILIHALVSVISFSFVNFSIEQRKLSMRRDLHYLTKSHAALSLTLLEEALRVASVSSLEPMLKDGTGELPEEIRQHVAKEGARKIFRVVDEQGIIRYSSFSAGEVGQRINDSYVIDTALRGDKVAATEKEKVYDAWVMRAAAPIFFEDGTLGGVVIGSDIGKIFELGEYVAVSPIAATGYGFISESGEQIYSAGSAIDGVTRMGFQKTFKDNKTFTGETADGTFVSMSRVYATDGSPDGLFYIYLTKTMLQGEIFRIISVITLMALLAVFILASVLIFSMSVVLRPIDELRQAAKEIEKENYDVRVAYSVPDEFGLLASSFNRMAATIGERTKKMRAAVQEERDFLAYTAHEMRNPLNIFRWTLELMRYGDTGKLNKEQLELLEQMHQTNQRIFDMVQNLLVAAGLEGGRVILEKAPVGIEEVVDSVAGELAVKMRQKLIQFHWNRPAKALPKVYGDRERIRQIMFNLLSNSMKYTGKNGHIEVTASLVNGADRGGTAGSFMKITVEDNGKGIPRDQQERIFSRFFRARNVVRSDADGIGLGLYITKKLVVLHGGRIWFDSKEDVGTVFSFTIPLAQES